MELLTQMINGLSTGGMYALVAIGYTMVYGIAKMINFAHGEIIMVGAYLTYVVSIAGCALLGVVTEKVAYKPLRNSSSLSVLITAIGVSYLLQNLFLILFGSAAITFPDFLPSGQLELLGLSISYVSLLSLILTFACTILLLLFINKTKLGKAMRAVSEDKGAAELMGINVNNTISMTFAIGSGLGAVAGIIYGLSYSLINPYLGAMLGIKAFIAAVLGGIGSIQGAMIGGLIIGVAEAFTVSYISSTFSDAVVFGILIFILLKTNYKNKNFGNNMSNKNLEEIEKYILDISSYTAKMDVTVESNKNTNKYVMEQKYEKGKKSKQKILEPANIEGLEIIYEENKLTINNAKDNLKTMYENYPNLMENCLWLNAFIEDYKIEKNEGKASIVEKNGKVIMATKTRNENNRYIYSKELHIDKEAGKIEKLVVQDINKKNLIYILYQKINLEI